MWAKLSETQVAVVGTAFKNGIGTLGGWALDVDPGGREALA